MSKAFDTVCRSKLLTDLQEILEPDEMHMMAVLIRDVVLTVKVGKELGEQIKTEVGIAQGEEEEEETLFVNGMVTAGAV